MDIYANYKSINVGTTMIIYRRLRGIYFRDTDPLSVMKLSLEFNALA